jgi:hypothetical protein
MSEPVTPSLTAGYLIALVGTIVSLALTQSLISNTVAQLVTGAASIIIPAVFTLVHGSVHAAHTAATIQARATVANATIRARGGPA